MAYNDFCIEPLENYSLKSLTCIEFVVFKILSGIYSLDEINNMTNINVILIKFLWYEQYNLFLIKKIVNL